MLAYGGFEGNGQTLRIVAKLEPYTEQHGMDLTRRTLLGLLKYPVLQPAFTAHDSSENPLILANWKPAKAIFAADSAILDWILAPLESAERQAFQQTEQLATSPWQKSLHKSLDASIMELADDIAYGVHDLEDAIVLGNISAAQWHAFTAEPFQALPSALQKSLAQLAEKLFAKAHHLRKDAIGSLVNMLITSVQLTESLPQASCPLIRFNASLPDAQSSVLNALKQLVFRCVIKQPAIQQSRFRSQNMLLELFDAFASDPERLLPLNTQQRWHSAPEGAARYRVICDYISGMTDDYATRMYHTLFGR
jgi:dGTPase